MAFVSLPSYSGAVKARKRRRGHVHGRYNGRGLKGEKSRGGRTHLVVLEGGQMPLVRRLPKRGFTNRRFAEKCEIVNLAILEAKFDAGADISVETLMNKGLVTGKNRVKLLGKGKITKSFNVLLDSVSEGAAKKINEAGGSIANQKKAAQEKKGKAADGRESASVPEPK